MLLEQLPADSAYARSVLGDMARWGEQEHLLAAIFDALTVGNWQRARAHFKGKPKAPEPLRRPGAASKAVKAVRPRDLARRMRGG